MTRNYHLALFTKGYIDLILNGSKTIESRFSKIKCAPYNKVSKGDLIYMKEISGPIKGIFVVEEVQTFTDLTHDDVNAIDMANREDIFGTNLFTAHIKRWKECRYATLMKVGKRIQVVHPPYYDNKGRSAWKVLDGPIPLDPQLDKVYRLED